MAKKQTVLSTFREIISDAVFDLIVTAGGIKLVFQGFGGGILKIGVKSLFLDFVMLAFLCIVVVLVAASYAAVLTFAAWLGWLGAHALTNIKLGFNAKLVFAVFAVLIVIGEVASFFVKERRRPPSVTL